MKILAVILCAAFLAGCAGRHPKGTAMYDNFDAVQVEQMVGNNVSPAVFAKTILCLNARRETRRVLALTNTIVTTVTNTPVITPITNQTISIATNFLWTSMTNLSPALPGAPVVGGGDTPPVGGETNLTLAATNPGPALSTNLTISVANNNSGTIAPNQRVANQQSVRTFNNQLTTTSNNLSVSVMTNVIVTAETNYTVTYVTNSSVASVTNVIITPTNGVAYDYFLFTELIPPPDFVLAPGESLVLLVDGVRYGFVAGPSATAFVARKGYASTLYRVPPDVLVAIANAKEVNIRLKGLNNVVERTMNTNSREHFREFIARYFAGPAPDKEVAALNAITPQP